MTLPQDTTRGRPISRKNRALTRSQALEIVRASDHCVLSTCDKAGVPYGVPVTPVLVDEVIYFHATARPESRRRENLLMNPAVSLCFIGKSTIIEDLFGVDYASAIVAGKASLVTEEDERLRAMRAIIARHAPHNPPELNESYLKKGLPFTQVWKVEIESVTGKARVGAERWKSSVSLKTLER
ncbi:MAG: pyridoxamine 5'-phosphate oxidase family protein [Mesosutterella sp.]|nr:pyridoxamine 5'-phosphate oxidase family protein [Mesosutterella sp.]